MIGKGNIATLHARLSGSGDLTVAATAGNADLEASGGGDIKVAHVTGVERKAASGGQGQSNREQKSEFERRRNSDPRGRELQVHRLSMVSRPAAKVQLAPLRRNSSKSLISDKILTEE